MNNPEEITYFAETDSRNRKVTFGIKSKDRTRHIYVIGKTGMGKSTLLENMAVQDIRNGNGFAFIDPHGKTADLFLEYIPEERKKDVIYFAPFDMEYPISFNVMEDVGFDKRHLVVSGLMSTFKKIWQDAWSARMEYILSNTLLALLEYPDSTLLDVNKMLSDKAFRNKVVANLTDISVKSFWVDEFAKYTDRMAAEATPAIQNKIGQFTANPLIRNIIGQPKSSFDIRQVMDDRKILIINLSKGRIGESNANLLGSMLITKIYLAALSRADSSEAELDKLPNFYLYVDEFQSFANDSFADILSEARKYKLNLTIAHQYIEQMSDEVRAAVFGNVGTMITFRIGANDAEVLEREFAPVFTSADIVNLGFAQIYLRLMIDGISSKPFSARTIGPLEKPESSIAKEVVEISRKQYANSREEVEAKIYGTNNPAPNLNNNSANNSNNSNHKKQSFKKEDKKQKPVIDEKTKNKLNQELEKIEKHKKEITEDSKEKNIEQENESDSLENISLTNLITKRNDRNEKNTGNGRVHYNDRKNNSDENDRNKNYKDKNTELKNSENKDSLKNALADILKNIKEDSVKRDSVNNTQKTKSSHDEKSRDSDNKKETKKEENGGPSDSSKFRETNGNKHTQGHDRTETKTESNSANELPTEKLRQVLGLD